MLKKENFVKKHYYFKRLFENHVLPVEERTREVYMDNINIHKRYNHNGNSIWDSNNNQNVIIEKAKYKIYCKIALLQPSKDQT
jgi:hypothetical protein